MATITLSAIFSVRSEACTNIIVTRGASADGSNMVSYAADSHWLYGELYFCRAAKWRKGSVKKIYEWDTYKYRGEIPQASRTLQTVGNMNERQLIIAETTWGGRMELMDPSGIMDYGSLIYTALERASTAREAINVIVSLADEFGYPSEGETFSIADKEEAWIMDLIGKGPEEKGIVWVARRIPDGYICAHANQARIGKFPQDDPENCLFSEDVISFARSRGWYDGNDADFSFCRAYCPLDFSTVRGCDGRVWSAFNILCDEVFTYEEDGEQKSVASERWLDYAMGYDLEGEMPLFVKPSRKLTVKDVADVMRDHFEGTPMDMTEDIGAGGNALPYRWRPLEWEWEGKTYVNERAIATQQTGFWFVAQARPQFRDEIGALLWFGVDDAATSYLTPVYVSTRKVPECLRVGNGNLLEYSPTSSFWLNNRIANACYKMYNLMAPYVRTEIDLFENGQATAVQETDRKMSSMKFRFLIRRCATKFTVRTAQKQFKLWKKLEETLLVKFIDGNVKAQNEDGTFKHAEDYRGMPDGLEWGGYTDKWKEAAVKDHGPVIEVK